MGTIWFDESPPVGPSEHYVIDWDLFKSNWVITSKNFGKALTEFSYHFDTLLEANKKLFLAFNHYDISEPDQPTKPSRLKPLVRNTGPRPKNNFDHRGRSRY